MGAVSAQDNTDTLAIDTESENIVNEVSYSDLDNFDDSQNYMDDNSYSSTDGSDNLQYANDEEIVDVSTNNKEILGASNKNVNELNPYTAGPYVHDYELEPFHESVKNILSHYESVSRGIPREHGGSTGVQVYWTPVFAYEGDDILVIVDVQDASFKTIKIQINQIGLGDTKMTRSANGEYFYTIIRNVKMFDPVKDKKGNVKNKDWGLWLNPQGSSHCHIENFKIYTKTSVTLAIDSNNIKIGETVKLTPTVMETTKGNIITSGKVEYYLSDGTLIGTSASNGYLQYTPDKVGNYNFYAKFVPNMDDSSNLYGPATSNTVDLTVNPFDTVINVEPVSGKPGTTVTSQITVEDEYGRPVKEGNIAVVLPNGEYVTVAVNNGVAGVEWSIPVDYHAGEYSVVAEYLGNDKYNPSGDVGSLNVLALDTVTVVGDVSGKPGETVDVVISVSDENGNAVRDGPMDVVLPDGVTVSVDVVDGVAVVAWDIPEDFRAGEYSVEAYYLGNDDYNPSSDADSRNVNVLPLNTVTVVGNATQRMGLLLIIPIYVADENGNPVRDGNLEIVLHNGDIINANVRDGRAEFSWMVPTNHPLGDFPVNVTYISNANYNSSMGIGYITIIPRQSDIEIIE